MYNKVVNIHVCTIQPLQIVFVDSYFFNERHVLTINTQVFVCALLYIEVVDSLRNDDIDMPMVWVYVHMKAF